MVHNLLLGFGG